MPPTYDEFLAWWDRNGQPSLEPPDWAGIIACVQLSLVDTWAAGNEAPYDLYVLGGRLAEAVGGGYEPTIRKGDIISPEVAAQVSDRVIPPRPDLVSIPDEYVFEDDVLRDGVLDLRHAEEDPEPNYPPDYIGRYVDNDGAWEQFPSGPPQLLTVVAA